MLFLQYSGKVGLSSPQKLLTFHNRFHFVLKTQVCCLPKVEKPFTRLLLSDLLTATLWQEMLTSANGRL